MSKSVAVYRRTFIKRTRTAPGSLAFARLPLDRIRGRIGAHDQRDEHAARANGREDVRHVRRFFTMAHIGLADDKLAKINELQLHGQYLSKVPVRCCFASAADRLSGSGGTRRAYPSALVRR